MSLEKYILIFFIYAFLGYICEVVYCSILQRKLVNRGYLYMPICPIYGFGALLILTTMYPLKDMWYLVFILGMILTSALEYITSYLMEVIFHMRWWDYTNRKFNINGRVCLVNSILFGLLVVLVVYGIQPLILKLIVVMDIYLVRTIDSILVLILIVDLFFSTMKNIDIAKIIKKIQELKILSSDHFSQMKNSAGEKFEETKDYFSNTSILVKLKDLISKYPNISLRKIGKGKKKMSIQEFIEKHLDKGDKKDEHNR